MKNLSLLFCLVFFGINSADALKGDQDGENDRQLLSSIIDFADKIQNAVPTVPTTPMPTDAPTLSSAPSPSPSSTPTEPPTTSMAPSVAPTNSPTVSHQPTNHPTVSSVPSTSPSSSPTEVPSASPSQAPTNSPTVSAAPSESPSVSPTGEPSSTPSVSPTNSPSVSPSEAPTNFPTVSAAPSLMYYSTLKANVKVTLAGIDTKMNATQIEVFERNSKFFIQQSMQSVEGAVLVTSVVVLGQSVLQVEGKGRKLQTASSSSSLKVEIRVVAEYESLVHPDDFDFGTTIQDGFEKNSALFKSNLLDSGDSFFAPLNPAHSSHANKNSDQEDGPLSKGGYIALIVLSIVVSMGAFCVAYYAVQRKKEENNKGDKLSEMNMYDDPVGSDVTQEDEGVKLKHSKSIEIIKVIDGTEDDDDDDVKVEDMKPDTPNRLMQDANKNTIEVDTIHGGSREGSYSGVLPSKSNPTRQQVMSPNTMENGRLGALAESIMRSDSFGSNRDPPESSGYKYAPKVNKGDPSANYRTTAFGAPRPDAVPPSSREEYGQRKGSLDAKRDPSVVGAPNFSSSALNSFFGKGKKEPEQEKPGPVFEQVQPHAERARSAPGAHAVSSGSRFDRPLDWTSEANQDMHLTVGRNGKLKPSAIPTNNFNDPRSGKMDPSASPSSSAVSSSINAFLNMVGGTLGAAPLASPAQKKEEKNQKFHDVLQREGLYDVFAPSGALGIVVDTTKEGPAVHSLKQTSPMLGLINPGDLIVGLDAQDTRSMTAATLTRLMASKSNQRERKITLLAADNY